MTNFWIRAEHPDESYQDFQISAEDRINAQIKAEQKIRLEKGLPITTNFRWHGMVVFVNPKETNATSELHR
jgi:hypothetical protein